MIFKVDHKPISHSRQRSVCCIEEGVRRDVVTWLNPFSFKHSPKNLGDIELWGIWRKEEQVQPSLLPQSTKGEQLPCPVYWRIVKHDNRLLLDSQRETVKEADHSVCVNAVCSCEPVRPAVAVNHGEAVESRTTLGRNINVFLVELPSVRDISLLTKVGLVSIIKFYGTVMPQLFKLLQLPKLVLVELRRGFSLWAFPYTSKSCANALKKRLRVSSQAVFPVAASHCALAVRTLERSSSMACRMISSSCVPIIGLRPCPGRVSRPLRPSDKKRFTQLLIETWCISSCSPICGELNPCAFSSTALHRIRKACDEPLRYPSSSADCCTGANSSFLILPIWKDLSYIDITDFCCKYYNLN